MRAERRALAGEPGSRSGDPRRLAAQLRELVPAPESVKDAVAEIIARVRADGDGAVIDYTRRFDTAGAPPGPLVAADRELDAAARALDPAVRAGLQHAIENVERVACEALRQDRTVDLTGHQVVLREAPVDRAAIYVPGGRAPYPSTVVMGVIPARAAGVEHVAVCAPPARDGRVDSVVLAACRLAGAGTVYAIGGAQAIAALAYGTESVSPVDVIVGPGNLYVQEAKLQVFGQVGIDGFAGPSDLVVIADGDADPGPLALDLLAQAEHGPGTLVIGISPSAALLDRLQERLQSAPDTGAVACLVEVTDAGAAGELANAIAPEHLQLVGRHAERLAPGIRHAGCVFVGAAAATAFGDYIAGSNHILPTAGAARYASALTPAHFRRSFTEVRIGHRAAAPLARAAAPVARAEGFEQHARSMEARIGDNGP
ncbi:MAG: histidinol dehydrogenase [Solirubrobacteraceae bacterium]